MMKKRLLVALTATATSILGTYAQVNSPISEGYLYRAVMMYDDANYCGCIDQLLNIDVRQLDDEQIEKAAYYRALATVHTDTPLALQLLEEFRANYPESFYTNDVIMAIGDCYYGTNYNKALNIYNNVYAASLSEAKQNILTYRRAYCYLQRDDYDRALPLFESLSGTSEYDNASKFYRGYIAYAKGDYATAEDLFRQVNTSTAPGNMADFYLSQIYYKRMDYKQALIMARNLLRNTNVGEAYIAEANRIAGESSYAIGDDSQAIRYLRQYVSMVEVPLPSACYILGMYAYNTGDYDEAIDYLSKATGQDNAMGQSAYLYLGQAYMHSDDYTSAAMAFNRALNMDYDSDVRETAYYNYAIASMNGGKVPFASTVKIFSDFLKLYPQSQYADAVQDYIIASYITDNDYAAALASINEMVAPSRATLAAKQRVLYVLGNKALLKSDATQALEYLNEAKSLEGYDKQIANETLLALGEANYMAAKYQASVDYLQQYIKRAPAGSENLQLAYFDLGYALYAQKRYGEAATQFEKAINTRGDFTSSTLADAYCRLADCQYYQKEFAKAEKNYERAYTENPSTGDYPLYQRALMAGYLRQYNDKVKILGQLQRDFPTSALIPNAMLEMTESYIQLGNNSKAIDVYTELVEKYPNTRQGRQALLQMALVKLNTGHRAAAVDDYKHLISKYPTSDEALQAVEQLKRIAASDGDLQSLQKYLASVANAPKLDNSEVEQLTFQEAEKIYLTQQKTDRLIKYVEQYPESTQTPRALAYIIDGEYASGNIDNAYEYASLLVTRFPSSSYTQQALVVKAEVEEAEGKGNLALRDWKQLAQTASTPAYQLKARMGITRTALNAEEYDDVIEAASAVLTTSGVDADVLAQAKYSLGYAYDKKGNTAEARKQWEDGAANTGLLYGIMSAHALAESYYQGKNYTQAEKWAKNVSNADSPHTYWIARGFITLSDVYAAQGDKYKARQYLEAVRDNYTGGETEIFEMIDKRLK